MGEEWENRFQLGENRGRNPMKMSKKSKAMMSKLGVTGPVPWAWEPGREPGQRRGKISQTPSLWSWEHGGEPGEDHGKSRVLWEKYGKNHVKTMGTCRRHVGKREEHAFLVEMREASMRQESQANWGLVAPAKHIKRNHGNSLRRILKHYWTCLVGGLEHQFYFPIYWECHHPNWLIFFRGVA